MSKRGRIPPIPSSPIPPASGPPPDPVKRVSKVSSIVTKRSIPTKPLPFGQFSIQTLQKQIKALYASKGALRRKYEALHEEHQMHVGKLAEARNDISNLRTELTDANNRATAANDDFYTVEKRKNELIMERDAERLANNKLHNDINKLIDEIKEANKFILETQQSKDQLSSELLELRVTYDQLASEFAKLRTDLATESAAHKQLAYQYEKTLEELANCKKELAHVEHQWNMTSDRELKLREELKQAYADHAFIVKENKVYKDEQAKQVDNTFLLNEYKLEIDRRTQRINELIDHNHSIEDKYRLQVRTLEDKYKRCQEELGRVLDEKLPYPQQISESAPISEVQHLRLIECDIIGTSAIQAMMSTLLPPKTSVDPFGQGVTEREVTTTTIGDITDKE